MLNYNLVNTYSYFLYITMECALCISPLVLQAYGIIFTSYVVHRTVYIAIRNAVNNLEYLVCL